MTFSVIIILPLTFSKCSSRFQPIVSYNLHIIIMISTSLIRRINKLLCTWMFASVILSRSFNTTKVRAISSISMERHNTVPFLRLPAFRCPATKPPTSLIASCCGFDIFLYSSTVSVVV